MLAVATGLIARVLYSPNGRYLAAASSDRNVYLFHVEQDYELLYVLRGNSSSVTDLVFSADSWVLMSNSADAQVLYWEVPTGARIANGVKLRDTEWSLWESRFGWPVMGIWQGKNDVTDVNAVSQSHRGDLVVLGDDNGCVELYRYPNAAECGYRRYAGHSSHVTNVKFSLDDKHVISTGGNDKCIFKWKVLPVDVGLRYTPAQKEALKIAKAGLLYEARYYPKPSHTPQRPKGELHQKLIKAEKHRRQQELQEKQERDEKDASEALPEEKSPEATDEYTDDPKRQRDVLHRQQVARHTAAQKVAARQPPLLVDESPLELPANGVTSLGEEEGGRRSCPSLAGTRRQARDRMKLHKEKFAAEEAVRHAAEEEEAARRRAGEEKGDLLAMQAQQRVREDARRKKMADEEIAERISNQILARKKKLADADEAAKQAWGNPLPKPRRSEKPPPQKASKQTQPGPTGEESTHPEPNPDHKPSPDSHSAATESKVVERPRLKGDMPRQGTLGPTKPKPSQQRQAGDKGVKPRGRHQAGRLEKSEPGTSASQSVDETGALKEPPPKGGDTESEFPEPEQQPVDKELPEEPKAPRRRRRCREPPSGEPDVPQQQQQQQRGGAVTKRTKPPKEQPPQGMNKAEQRGSEEAVTGTYGKAPSARSAKHLASMPAATEEDTRKAVARQAPISPPMPPGYHESVRSPSVPMPRQKSTLDTPRPSSPPPGPLEKTQPSQASPRRRRHDAQGVVYDKTRRETRGRSLSTTILATI